jgi:hypothetical protein
VYTEPQPAYPAQPYSEAMREEPTSSSCYLAASHHQQPLFGAPAHETDYSGTDYTVLGRCHEDVPMNLVTEVGTKIPPPVLTGEEKTTLEQLISLSGKEGRVAR